MKILTLNGSPRGAASNTFQLTQAFLEGLRQELESPLIVKTRMINELKPVPGMLPLLDCDAGHMCYPGCDGGGAGRNAVSRSDPVEFPIILFRHAGTGENAA